MTPTIDELVSGLQGAKMFSKIGLRSGYHQLVPSPDCRYITLTTFSTHMGMYRYKRLRFSINSAAKVFQHAIQTVLEDVRGAIKRNTIGHCPSV